jgi:hypothetical protein
MAWGRRRYRSSPVVRSTRVIEAKDYWELKRLKSKGKPTTLTLLCDGSKMHKITFWDRGPVQLHNHNLKAERALGELGQEKLPRCTTILKQWKEGTHRVDYALHARIGDAIKFREAVRQLHSSNSVCFDADGLDMPHHTRLKAILDSWYNMKAKAIEELNKSGRSSWGYRGEEFVATSKINVKKFGLLLKRKEKTPIVAPYIPKIMQPTSPYAKYSLDPKTLPKLLNINTESLHKLLKSKGL